MMRKVKVGDVFITKSGCTVCVVEYNSWDSIVVEFDSPRKHRVITDSNNLRKGFVKNPYIRSVCDMGYLGAGKWKSREKGKKTPAYACWESMIRRVYRPPSNSRCKAYRDVVVDEIWHNFQNFANWFSEQPNADKEGFDLDKDLLVMGNKVYSPRYCSFVPRAINRLMTTSVSTRGDLPTGVSRKGKRFGVKLSVENTIIRLGSYDTLEEAYEVYIKHKTASVRMLADKYKADLHPAVYKNLISWEPMERQNENTVEYIENLQEDYV